MRPKSHAVTSRHRSYAKCSGVNIRYNHRWPHQSLEGLCPADRFFAIAQELRKSSSAAGKTTCWNWRYEGNRAAPSTWLGGWASNR